MTEAQQQQLIRQITEQVLKVLRDRTSGAGEPSLTGPATRAQLHPPAGVCTGDYSKFTDRPDLARHARPAAQMADRQQQRAVVSAISGTRASSTPRAPQASAPKPSSSDARSLPVLRGFVTASRLAQLDGSVVRLAADARLTPLARDMVKDRGLTIQRADQSDAPGGARLAGGRYFWWIDGQCPIFDELTERQADRAVISAQASQADALVAVIRDLANQTRQRRVEGGVLFVSSPARACAYANRCRSLRALVGTCEQTVRDAIDQLAANVLIIEYRRCSAMQMRAMVETFVSRSRPEAGAIERDLSELSRCG